MKKTAFIALIAALMLFSLLGSALEWTMPEPFDPVFMPGPGGPFEDAQAQAGSERISQSVLDFLETEGIQGYEPQAWAGDGHVLGLALKKDGQWLFVMLKGSTEAGFEVAFRSDTLLRKGEAAPLMYFPADQEGQARFQLAYAQPEPGILRETLVLIAPEGGQDWALGSYTLHTNEEDFSRFEPQENGDWKLTQWQDGRPESATFLRSSQMLPDPASFVLEDFPKTPDEATSLSSWWYSVMPSTYETQAIQFPRGRSWPVYSGPGEEYYRTGNGRAEVSTNGEIEVVGWENGWIMVNYLVSDTNAMRAGYIHADALPKGAKVELYNPLMIRGDIIRQALLTDNASVSRQSAFANLDQGSAGKLLKVFNNKYAHMEFVGDGGEKIRGFVPLDNVFIPGKDVQIFEHSYGFMTVFLSAWRGGTDIEVGYISLPGSEPDAIQVLMEGRLLGTLQKKENSSEYEKLEIPEYLGTLSFVPVLNGAPDHVKTDTMAIPGALLADMYLDFTQFKGEPYR